MIDWLHGVLHWLNYWLSQNTGDWMPRAMCVLYNPVVIFLNILGESLITLAYMAMPIILWYVVRQRKEFFLEYSKVIWLFGLFIFLCGTSHFIGIIMFMYPVYWIDSAEKITTGIVSLFTAYVLYKAIPSLMSLPTHRELEKVLEDKDAAEIKANHLQEQVQVWTAEVGEHIDKLKSESEKLRKNIKS